MTLIAWDGERVAGLARSTADPAFKNAECAVIIRADLREKGLARALIDALTRALSTQGIAEATLVFPAGHERLVNLSKDLGFTITPDEAGQMRATKPLSQRP